MQTKYKKRIWKLFYFSSQTCLIASMILWDIRVWSSVGGKLFASIWLRSYDNSLFEQRQQYRHHENRERCSWNSSFKLSRKMKVCDCNAHFLRQSTGCIKYGQLFGNSEQREAYCRSDERQRKEKRKQFVWMELHWNQYGRMTWYCSVNGIYFSFANLEWSRLHCFALDYENAKVELIECAMGVYWNISIDFGSNRLHVLVIADSCRFGRSIHRCRFHTDIGWGDRLTVSVCVGNHLGDMRWIFAEKKVSRVTRQLENGSKLDLSQLLNRKHQDAELWGDTKSWNQCDVSHLPPTIGSQWIGGYSRGRIGLWVPGFDANQNVHRHRRKSANFVDKL